MEERSSTVNFAPAAAAGPSSAPATAGGADRRVSLTNRLSRGDTITIAGKTMTVKEKITFRLRVRLLLSSMNAELSMLAVVLVYCAFVFVELALDDQNIRTLIDTETRRVLKDVFLWADFVFLIFFMVELAVKLYAFGLSYLRDLFNGIDALIVVVSFALALVAVELDLGASSDQLMRAMPVLRVVKVVRLLRVVLMMTRLQRSRERYRRMKMIGIGAPVERVLQVAAAAASAAATTTRAATAGGCAAGAAPQEGQAGLLHSRCRDGPLRVCTAGREHVLPSLCAGHDAGRAQRFARTRAE